jgi:HSP90 family molecular chaperone
VQERRLKDLIKKHSEFISYPISLWTEKTVEKVGQEAAARRSASQRGNTALRGHSRGSSP